MSCTKGILVSIGGITIFGTITAVLESVNVNTLPATATIAVNGVQYIVPEGTYQAVAGGKVGVFGVSVFGVCIDIQELIATGTLDSGSGCGVGASKIIDLGTSYFVTAVDYNLMGSCVNTGGSLKVVLQGSDIFSTYADSPWQDFPAGGMQAQYIRLKDESGLTNAYGKWAASVYAGASSPAPAPTPPPTPIPGPVMQDCSTLTLDYSGFFPFLTSIYNILKCYLSNIISSVAYIITQLEVIPQMFIDLEKNIIAAIASALSPITDLITKGITDIRNDLAAASTDISNVAAWVDNFQWPDFGALITSPLSALAADLAAVKTWADNFKWPDWTTFFDTYFATPMHNWLWAELGLDPTLDFWTAIESKLYTLITNIMWRILDDIFKDWT